MFIKYLIIVFILNLISAEYSFSKEKVFENLAHEIYSTAKKKLQNKDWKQAISQLEKLNNYYPYGPCLEQVQLNLIYAYYKNNNLLFAQDIIDRFLRLNPNHPNIDYVIYMRGLTHMALDNNTMLRFFGIDYSDRDSQYARLAFNDFIYLVRNYPNCKYVTDAIKRLVFLKNRLAKLDYLIANYYMNRGAWIAVVNRIEDMLREYPDSYITKEGLKLMANAYRQMHMNLQANKVAKIISANKISTK